MTSSSEPILFGGIARVVNEKAVLLCYASTAAGGAFDLQSVSKMLESNRVKFLLQQSESTSSAAKPHVFPVATINWHVSIDSRKIIYIFICPKKFSQSSAQRALVELRDAFLSALEMQSIGSIDNYLLSKAASKDLSLDPSCKLSLSSILDTYKLLFVPTTTAVAIIASAGVAAADKNDIASIASSSGGIGKKESRAAAVALKLEAAKGNIGGLVVDAVENCVSPTAVEEELKSLEDSTFIFKKAKSWAPDGLEKRNVTFSPSSKGGDSSSTPSTGRRLQRTDSTVFREDTSTVGPGSIKKAFSWFGLGTPSRADDDGEDLDQTVDRSVQSMRGWASRLVGLSGQKVGADREMSASASKADSELRSQQARPVPKRASSTSSFSSDGSSRRVFGYKKREGAASVERQREVPQLEKSKSWSPEASTPYRSSSPMPPARAASTTSSAYWSDVDDAELDDSTSSRSSRRSGRISKERIASVLGMTPDEAPISYGLALSGGMIDVSDIEFWTKKECRSIDGLRRRQDEGPFSLRSTLPPSRSQSPETRQLSSELALLKDCNYQLHKGNFLENSLSRHHTEKTFRELGGVDSDPLVTPVASTRPRQLSRAVITAIESETEATLLELRTAAVRALQESHGKAAASLLDVNESLPPTPITKKRHSLNDDGTPKTVEDLLMENEKLRALLQSTIPNLPPVPDNESLSQIKNFQIEVQSLNLQIKAISQEMLAMKLKHEENITALECTHLNALEARAALEKKKTESEIMKLNKEIVQLKEAIKKEQRDAEASIQIILESGASQVMSLQETHDLKAAFQRGLSSADREIKRLQEEVSTLQEEKRRIEIESQESIRLVVESGAAQVFSLQEELSKSQTTVEAVTRLARGLLRPTAP